LADPTLQLVDGNGSQLAFNDDWRSNQQAEIIATSVAPSNDAESAIVATLAGNGTPYTAIVRGAGDSTGIAVVEVYALN
jgi:acetyl-CoA carboxylase alpha subunit